MTVNIDSDARIERILLQDATGTFSGDPSAGYSWLYTITGSSYGGLYLEKATGEIIGPFVTGSASAKFFDSTAGVSGTASFSITSIPATYAKIEISIYGRSVEGALNNDGIITTFNTDTTDTNYQYARHRADNTSHTVNTSASRYSGLFATAAAADNVSLWVGELVGYDSTAFHKVMRSRSSIRSNGTTLIGGSEVGLFWESTSAITQIDLTTNTGENFAEGTRCIAIGYFG